MQVCVRTKSIFIKRLNFLFILWLPFKMNRTVLMLLAALTHADSRSIPATIPVFSYSRLCAYRLCKTISHQPALFQEGAEVNYEEPSIRSLVVYCPHIIYSSILIMLHNAWLFFWKHGSLRRPVFFQQTFLSTIISLMLVIITELIFPRKQTFSHKYSRLTCVQNCCMH